MLAVFEHAGFVLDRELEGGTLEVTFPIASTAGFEERVEERDHVAVVASLRPFFEPGTVAVIGASPRRGTIGGELFRNVLAADFRGAAYPVNRAAEPVAGVRAYRSIGEIPDEELDTWTDSTLAALVLATDDDTIRSRWPETARGGPDPRPSGRRASHPAHRGLRRCPGRSVRAR